MQIKTGVAALGTMTTAIKAERLLSELGLKVGIVSLSPGETRRGCAYGIEYDLLEEGHVRRALQSARISVSQYLRRGGTPL